ncbi:hypothetical protein GCM10009872_22440 [Actinopolymorpha rutila]
MAVYPVATQVVDPEVLIKGVGRNVEHPWVLGRAAHRCHCCVRPVAQGVDRLGTCDVSEQDLDTDHKHAHHDQGGDRGRSDQARPECEMTYRHV